MTRGRPLSQSALARRVQIAKALHAGTMTYAEIADRMGCSVRMVQAVASRIGCARPAGRPPAWPDCPADLRDDYQRAIRAGFPAAEARAIAERSAGRHSA